MRILLLDIETAPSIAYVWGLFNENIPLDRLIKPGYILCWSAKWYGEPGVMFDSVHASSRKEMLRGIHKLLNEADAVVHYNGKRFDIPNINREFITNGMNPPSPYEQIDLLPEVRKQFKFASNKLTHVVEELGIGQKVKHAPFSMWIGCMEGNPKAWKEMEQYNRNDTVLLEDLYDLLRPWLTKHPNQGLYIESDKPVCPICNSTHLKKDGFRYKKTQKYQKYFCHNCKSYPVSRNAIKENRDHVLNLK